MDATPAPMAPGRAAGAVAAWLATAIAVTTVLAYSVALARHDVTLGAEDLVPPWLRLTELAAVAVMVLGTWIIRSDHPRASTGLAAAAVGSLLPLWAAWSWLAAPARAGVLAATPLTVAGTAQVALGWPPTSPATTRRAGRAVVRSQSWDLSANAGRAAGRADDGQDAARHLDPVGETTQAAGIGQ